MRLTGCVGCLYGERLCRREFLRLCGVPDGERRLSLFPGHALWKSATCVEQSTKARTQNKNKAIGRSPCRSRCRSFYMLNGKSSCNHHVIMAVDNDLDLTGMMMRTMVVMSSRVPGDLEGSLRLRIYD